jgi:hypothetical protein
LILEFYKYYRRGLRKAISVLLDYQNSIPFRTSLVQLASELLELISKRFFFIRGDTGEEVVYHDMYPRFKYYWQE